MAIYKNVASQKIAVYAHDTSADEPKTGDAANISAQISLDGGATAATNDAAPTELDATDAPGIYIFDLTQAETNADLIILCAVSATDDIQIEPVIIYTLPGTNAGVTGSLPDGHITAAKLGADCITADKIADDAITADHIAAEAIVAATFAAGAINAAAIADAAIDNATFAADVGSTAYATNVIALAVRKVLDELNLDHLMKTAVANNADMTTEVADGTVLSNIMSASSDTSTYVVATDSLEGIAGAGGGGAPTAEQVADAVWDELQSGHVAAGSFGEIATEIASILADTGTDGVVVAAASKTGYSLTATTGLGNQTANITGNLSGSVGSVTGNVGGNVVGSVASVASGVTLANGAHGGAAASLTLADYSDFQGAGGADAATIYTYFTAESRQDAFKATGFLTTLGANAPAGWINAAAIAASALNGKGDWNTTTPPTADAISLQIATNIADPTGEGAGYGSAGEAWIAAVDEIQDGLSTYDGSDTSGTTTLLERVVGTIAAGTHTAQSGDAYAYLGTNLGALGANATEAGGTGDHLTAVAPAATALSTATWTAEKAGFLDAAISSRGTGVALDAVGIRAAIGLASANLDTQIGTLATAASITTLDTLVDKLAPIIIGTVTGAGTGTEVFVYGGVTATVTVDEDGNRSVVAFS